MSLYLAPADYHLYTAVGPALSSADQTLIAPYLEAAEDILHAYMEVANFSLETDATLLVHGTGHNILDVGGRYVQSITSVKHLQSDEETLITDMSTWCRVTPRPPKRSCVNEDDERVWLFDWIEAKPEYQTLDGVFVEGQIYEVVGTFGCDIVPAVIKMAVAQMGSQLYQRSELMDEVRSTMGSGQLTQFQDANWMTQRGLIPRAIQTLLIPWRRRNIQS